MDIFFVLPVLVLIALAAGAVFMFVQQARAGGSGLTMERAIAEVMGTANATPKAKTQTKGASKDEKAEKAG